MKQLFSDISGFMKNLSQVDLLLYFAILVLIILVVSLIYIIKNTDEEEDTKFNKEEIDLNDVVSNIENTKPPTVEFTSYEKDQDEKSIISYDELIAKNKTGNLNYNEEETIDDEIFVKKIDLDSTITDAKEEKNIKKSSILFKYANEEEFLKTLKALNELLD